MFLKKARSAVRFSVTINITAALISAVIFFNIFTVFQTGFVFTLPPLPFTYTDGFGKTVYCSFR